MRKQFLDTLDTRQGYSLDEAQQIIKKKYSRNGLSYYLEKYGEDFFNNTIPYLTVTNQTKNYSFEVEINDYANSWYINIPDSDCKYDVVLFRKPKNA